MAILNRQKNAIMGTTTGVILQIFNLLIPFFIRSVFIRLIGIEYAGLGSLFSSVIQVLNLAELGVGSALVFSMYKPIAEDDADKICVLMKLYRTYYRIIGSVVLVIGLALTPFLPYLIKGDVPSDINLYIIYYLNLGATVVSYWLFAYKNALFQAHQRTDIVNTITFSVNFVKYCLQILVIFLWRNYYLYLITAFCFQVILNCILAAFSVKIYPQYKARGNIDPEEKKVINSKVRALFTAKLGGVIVNSADSIVISAFLGLRVLAIYNNYYYILSALFAIINVFYSACRAGVANELIVDSKEKNETDFYRFSFITAFIIAICAPCLLTLYEPFMLLWIGEDFLFDKLTVILFVLYFVVYELPLTWVMYKDAAGIWHQDRFRPLIGALTNLIVNVLLVRYIGVYGVLLSTILSFCIVNVPWLLVNIHRYIIQYHIKKYLLRWLAYLLCIAVICVTSNFLCGFVPLHGFVKLILNLLISLATATALFALSFCWSREFRSLYQQFKNAVATFVKRTFQRHI